MANRRLDFLCALGMRNAAQAGYFHSFFLPFFSVRKYRPFKKKKNLLQKWKKKSSQPALFYSPGRSTGNRTFLVWPQGRLCRERTDFEAFFRNVQLRQHG